MKIEDEGIVISASKFGDKGFIIKIFSRKNGVIKGLLSGQKKISQSVQQGNLISFSWNARLEEHLGKLSVNIERPYPLLNYESYPKMLAISSACAIFDKILQEREDMERLYLDFIEFLENLNTENWLREYSILETKILRDCGFGLDLESCSLTGATTNLYYISPKTGAAATKEAGERYKDRLFIIPQFFLENSVKPTISDIVEALNITRYFLAKSFFAENKQRIPSPASNFVEEILRLRDNEQRQKRHYN